jgi:hypothetical protein
MGTARSFLGGKELDRTFYYRIIFIPHSGQNNNRFSIILIVNIND